MNNAVKVSPDLLSFNLEYEAVTVGHVGTWLVEIRAPEPNSFLFSFELVIVPGCERRYPAIVNQEPYVYPTSDYVWVTESLGELAAL